MRGLLSLTLVLAIVGLATAGPPGRMHNGPPRCAVDDTPLVTQDEQLPITTEGTLAVLNRSGAIERRSDARKDADVTLVCHRRSGGGGEEQPAMESFQGNARAVPVAGSCPCGCNCANCTCNQAARATAPPAPVYFYAAPTYAGTYGDGNCQGGACSNGVSYQNAPRRGLMRRSRGG